MAFVACIWNILWWRRQARKLLFWMPTIQSPFLVSFLYCCELTSLSLLNLTKSSYASRHIVTKTTKACKEENNVQVYGKGTWSSKMAEDLDRDKSLYIQLMPKKFQVSQYDSLRRVFLKNRMLWKKRIIIKRVSEQD